VEESGKLYLNRISKGHFTLWAKEERTFQAEEPAYTPGDLGDGKYFSV
jgi:hypothetical protein